MPYGDLVKMRMQRFDSYDDLAAADCTIEEREEYEPHLAQGSIVYAGVDYEEILRNAEKEADVILWDGGNNDFSFYRPDLNITVADPLRAGHEMLYHPGETNLRMADVVVINKVDSALPADVKKLRRDDRFGESHRRRSSRHAPRSRSRTTRRSKGSGCSWSRTDRRLLTERWGTARA